ncbi:MAG: Lar family restriction alleviation protein [Nitrosomonadales bacterium]|nr:Lar family restriction alleviation protein [Nitrosomonadales bacterium]
MNNLDVCPFCGSPHTKSCEVDINGWMVECMGCRATGPIGRTEALSAAAWNKRFMESQPVSTTSA